MSHTNQNIRDWQLLRFILVGGSATLLQFVLLHLFVTLNLMAALYATALSYVISAIFNYSASYFYTFGSQAEHANSIIKFICMNLVGLGINTTIFYIAETLVFNNYLLSQLSATAFVFLSNYFLSKFWVFS